MREFDYKNRHQVPGLEKIVINSGISALEDKARVEEIGQQISAIAGQRGIYTLANKSISNFKLREGMKNGFKVTLRGANMYEFFYRLTNVILSNLRDFRGISPKMDGCGNYNMGLSDCTIFHEVTMEANRKALGMDIAFVTSAQTDKEGLKLLKLMGMPFRKIAKSTA